MSQNEWDLGFFFKNQTITVLEPTKRVLSVEIFCLITNIYICGICIDPMNSMSGLHLKKLNTLFNNNYIYDNKSPEKSLSTHLKPFNFMFIIGIIIVGNFNPLMLSGSFNICCPRDCVSRHNGGTSVPPLNPSESIVF